jgi:hypothetical protein
VWLMCVGETLACVGREFEGGVRMGMGMGVGIGCEVEEEGGK